MPEFVSIDEQPNHEIVHALRLGEAQRAADEPLDPGPQIDVFALDFLRVLLAHLMLLGIEMPLVGSPAVGVKLRDAKRCQQLLELQEDVVLAVVRTHTPRPCPCDDQWRATASAGSLCSARNSTFRPALR